MYDSLSLIYFVLYAFVFIFGCMIGSFLNVVVYRVPIGISVAKGRSFCPNCGKPIAFYDNIPLLSYLWLRGKCRKCGAKIAPRYFFTELCGGLLALLMAGHYDFGLQAVVGFAVAAILLAVTLIDFDTMTIPNGLVIALIIPVAASYFVFLEPSLSSHAGLITGHSRRLWRRGCQAHGSRWISPWLALHPAGDLYRPGAGRYCRRHQAYPQERGKAHGLWPIPLSGDFGIHVVGNADHLLVFEFFWTLTSG